MQEAQISIPLTPELTLAIEAGMRDGIKSLYPKGDDPRTKVASDRSLKGLKINMTLAIDEVTIGHDTDKAPTASIPLLPALALMVKRMGATREDALKTLRECLQQAIDLDEKAEKHLLAEEGVTEVVDQIKKEVIATLPRTFVSKPVKATGATLTITGVTQA
jgi:hypothetical protein